MDYPPTPSHIHGGCGELNFQLKIDQTTAYKLSNSRKLFGRAWVTPPLLRLRPDINRTRMSRKPQQAGGQTRGTVDY